MPNSTFRKHLNKGLTLIELLATLGIAAIVLTFAIPSSLQLIRNNEISTTSSDLVNSIFYARSEAIRQGLAVCACSSSNQSSCSGGSNWSDGWLIWVDTNNNAILDGAEQIAYILDGYSKTQTTNANALFCYLPSGYLAIAPGTQFQFKICDSRTGETGRLISINTTGSPFVSQWSCS